METFNREIFVIHFLSVTFVCRNLLKEFIEVYFAFSKLCFQIYFGFSLDIVLREEYEVSDFRNTEELCRDFRNSAKNFLNPDTHSFISNPYFGVSPGVAKDF